MCSPRPQLVAEPDIVLVISTGIGMSKPLAYLYYDKATDTVVQCHLPKCIEAQRSNWKTWVKIQYSQYDDIGSILSGEFIHPDTKVAYAYSLGSDIVLLNKDKIPIDVVSCTNLSAKYKNGTITVTGNIGPMRNVVHIRDIRKVINKSYWEVSNNYIVYKTLTYEYLIVDTDDMYVVHRAVNSIYATLARELQKRPMNGIIIVANKYGLFTVRGSGRPWLYCCSISDDTLHKLACLNCTNFRFVTAKDGFVGILLCVSDTIGYFINTLPTEAIIGLILGEPYPNMDVHFKWIKANSRPEDAWLVNALANLLGT